MSNRVVFYIMLFISSLYLFGKDEKLFILHLEQKTIKVKKVIYSAYLPDTLEVKSTEIDNIDTLYSLDNYIKLYLLRGNFGLIYLHSVFDEYDVLKCRFNPIGVGLTVKVFYHDFDGDSFDEVVSVWGHEEDTYEIKIDKVLGRKVENIKIQNIFQSKRLGYPSIFFDYEKLYAVVSDSVFFIYQYNGDGTIPPVTKIALLDKDETGELYLKPFKKITEEEWWKMINKN